VVEANGKDIASTGCAATERDRERARERASERARGWGGKMGVRGMRGGVRRTERSGWPGRGS
jgi:hypothetical protein